MSVKYYTHKTGNGNPEPSAFRLVIGVVLIMISLGFVPRIFGWLSYILDVLWAILLFIIGTSIVVKYFLLKKRSSSTDARIEVFNKDNERFYMTIVTDEDGNPKADIKRAD
ncbi:MAG: hypothetical protein LBP35_02565 [Candidatus Ancillula trichonymphae]|jgi:hypothetical protein|nr:hypothetical protein [Candidatus Ancillula trichonymphae]